MGDMVTRQARRGLGADPISAHLMSGQLGLLQWCGLVSMVGVQALCTGPLPPPWEVGLLLLGLSVRISIAG